nr:hypothetical protein [Tanacetum cinerariifolium]
MFWTEAVSTACYVLNRVSITNLHNKTPYELLSGKIPNIRHLKPFGCQVTILNTSDHLGKFEGKANDGFLSWICCSYIPTSSVPTGGVLAGSGVPASDVPVGSFAARSVPADGVLAGSLVSTDSAASSVPAASVLVPAVVSTDSAATSPLPPILRDLQSPVQTRSTVQKSKFGEKPSSVANSLADPDWVAAMQEEMQQFYHQQNKRDARGIVVRNKARLVAQGHRQEEGIDYDEVFVPVARIEAIRLFLAFASYMGFMVYQMDVKSTFLYGEIEKEVYVTQPKGFEDPYNPKHVYRVFKALYGLHQVPRAWYARLSTFLLKHNYKRGTIDKTLFLKKDSRHIILVQVYVDDIIFGSKNKAWCDEFEVLMKGEFKMSAMASRPDIMFAVSACSRHQVSPLTSHLNAVKKIFKYLKGQPNLCLSYSRDSPFQLEAYSDSDYAG